MAGFFARVKQWIGLENLTFQDLNSEINNIIQKVGADTISGANSTNGSASTVNAMQATQNPGSVGTEVLARTLQDDIKQLRYQLNALIGSAQWYSSPAQSIASLNGLVNGISYVPSNRIISGRLNANDQPMFLVPSGSADTITLKATTTNLATYINGTAYTFTADATITGLSLAPSTNNTCLVDNGTSYFTNASQASKALGERGTTIKIKTIGSAISALNGTYAAFKSGTEYFIAEVDASNSQLKNAWRGVGFDSSDAWLARTTLTDGGTITLMKLSWIFGTNAGALDVTYNKPSVSFVAPTSPAIGDYWQDLSVQQWKKYSGTTWVNQSAVMLGLCIQDTTNCKCARSFDFFKGLAVLNDIELEYVGNTDVRSNRLGSKISVYGTVWSFEYDFVTWNTTNQLDSGESLTSSTTYYAYITDKGDRFISTVQPYDRRFDLLGHYMPNKPWRCVGEFATDGSSHVTSSSVIFDRYHQIALPPGGQPNQLMGINSEGTYAGWITQIGRSNLPTIGQQVSSSSGNFNTTAGSFVDVTNLSISITTTGRPVVVLLMPDGNGSSNSASLTVSSGASGGISALFRIMRGSTEIARTTVFIQGTAVSSNLQSSVPPGALTVIDPVAAGTYTYKVQALSSFLGAVNYCVISAYEL
jgi:hypothetical protein